jgi:hypothetical protein
LATDIHGIFIAHAHSVDGIASYVQLSEDRRLDQNLVDSTETLDKGTLRNNIPVITEEEKTEF